MLLSAVTMGSAALIGAGITSLIGDRLWLGSNYRVIPPDNMRHSNLSRMISASSIILGSISLVVIVLITNRVI